MFETNARWSELQMKSAATFNVSQQIRLRHDLVSISKVVESTVEKAYGVSSLGRGYQNLGLGRYALNGVDFFGPFNHYGNRHPFLGLARSLAWFLALQWGINTRRSATIRLFRLSRLRYPRICFMSYDQWSILLTLFVYKC